MIQDEEKTRKPALFPRWIHFNPKKPNATQSFVENSKFEAANLKLERGESGILKEIEYRNVTLGTNSEFRTTFGLEIQIDDDSPQKFPFDGFDFDRKNWTISFSEPLRFNKGLKIFVLGDQAITNGNNRNSAWSADIVVSALIERPYWISG